MVVTSQKQNNMVQDLVHNLCESLVTNIGDIADTGKRTPPAPITYLTQWKIVGNSEVHGNEIWSCGEYNAVDGKYHILVQPLGGSIADIALDEPLRKVNDVADTIEFPSGTDGKALVTRNLASAIFGNYVFGVSGTIDANITRWYIKDLLAKPIGATVIANGLSNKYAMVTANDTYMHRKNGISIDQRGYVLIYDSNYNTLEDKDAIEAANINTELIYELVTPTTELVDAPQIEEADSYTCVIGQDAKAVSWSSFETE